MLKIRNTAFREIDLTMNFIPREFLTEVRGLHMYEKPDPETGVVSFTFWYISGVSEQSLTV